MTLIQTVLLNKRASRTIDWLIIVLVCLLVPYTHGYLQFFGLIAAGILLSALKTVIFRSRYSNG